MNVPSLAADTRFDWKQMKMHILERRDAILAHFVVGVVEEEAHRRVLRRLLAQPRRKAGKYLDCVYQRAGLMRTSRIASQRDLEIRKAVIALRKQASTGSEENLRRDQAGSLRVAI